MAFLEPHPDISQAPQFTYSSSLRRERIRLLLLDPLPSKSTASASPGNLLIRAKIVEHPINEAPHYIALSYTWGPPELETKPYEAEDMKPILLNSSLFYIYPNLMDALRQFQSVISSKSDLVPIWIDAICINQKDLTERAAQVGIMDKIYSMAGLVFVWLGKEDQDKEKAVRILKAVKNVTASQSDMLHTFQGSIPKRNKILHKHGLPSINDDAWECLSRFLRARYFNRIWVFQELALSQQNILFQGEKAIEWSDLTDSLALLGFFIGVSAMHNLSPLLRECHWISDVEYMRGQVWLYTGTTEPTSTTLLMALALRSQDASATDPRDKVFGLLGIVNYFVSEKHIRGLKKFPNYDETVTVVFERLMQEVISEVRNLTILGAIRDRKEGRLQDLPSWAIDFLVGESGEELLAVKPLFDASRKTYTHSPEIDGDSVPEFHFDNHRLRVRSVVLGQVSALRWTRKDMFDASSLMQLESLSQTYHFTGESIVEAFWRTSLANSVHRQYPAQWPDVISGEVFRSFITHEIFKPGELDSPKSFQILDQLAKIDSNGHLPSSELLRVTAGDNFSRSTRRGATNKRVDDFQYQSSLFTDAVSLSMTQRRIIESDKGHLALAPESSQIGDSIVILEGCRVPLVLRPHFEDSTCFIIVGSAYVHGVMHGQAMSSDTEWNEVWID